MKVISALGFVSVAFATPGFIASSTGKVRIRTTGKPANTYNQAQFVAGEAVISATGTQAVPGALDGQFGNLAFVPGSPDYLGGASFWGGEQVVAAPAAVMYDGNTWETPAAASWEASWNAPAMNIYEPATVMYNTWETPAAASWEASWNAPAMSIYEPAPAWNNWEATPAVMPAWNNWEAAIHELEAAIYGVEAAIHEPMPAVMPAWNNWEAAISMPLHELEAAIYDLEAAIHEPMPAVMPAWNNWEAAISMPAVMPAWNNWEAAIYEPMPAWEQSWSAPVETSWESSWSAPVETSWESSWSAPVQTSWGSAPVTTGSWNDGMIYNPSTMVNGIYTPSSWSSPSTQPANPLGPHTTLIAATTSGAFKPRIQGTNTPNPQPGSPSGGGGSCSGIGCGQTVQWGW